MQMRFFIPLGVFWLGAIGAGLGFLADYAAQPGLVGQVPPQWPANTQLVLADDTLTLVLAVHPRCPCTRATINELERALTHAQQTPTIYALVFEPASDADHLTHDAFARTDITKRLLALPGVVHVPDPDSMIAARFGALTSGHLLVYDPDAALVYSGGLTPTRAHEGPNTGTATLVSLFNGEDALATAAPVYGCPLCTESNTPGPETCFSATTCTEDTP